MTSLLVKVKREKRQGNADRSSGFDLKKVKKEKIEEEDHDSGHSSFDTSLPVDWDQKFIKLERVSPREPLDQIATQDAIAFQMTPTIIHEVNKTFLTSDLVSPRDIMSNGKLDQTATKSITKAEVDSSIIPTSKTTVEVYTPVCAKVFGQNRPRRLTFTEGKYNETDAEEKEEQLGEETIESSNNRSGLFSRESKFSIFVQAQFNLNLKCLVTLMMYGAGDGASFEESIKLLNDVATDYITEITCKAMSVGKVGQIDVDDILYLTRKDGKKHARIKILIELNEELKAARKAFDVNSIVKPSGHSFKSFRKNSVS